MGSFSLFHWVSLFIIGFAVYAVVKGLAGRAGGASDTGEMICPSCGTRCNPKTITKGSTLIELILWICLIIPGLIYSIWRLTSRQK